MQSTLQSDEKMDDAEQVRNGLDLIGSNEETILRILETFHVGQTVMEAERREAERLERLERLSSIDLPGRTTAFPHATKRMADEVSDNRRKRLKQLNEEASSPKYEPTSPEYEYEPTSS